MAPGIHIQMMEPPSQDENLQNFDLESELAFDLERELRSIDVHGR